MGNNGQRVSVRLEQRKQKPVTVARKGGDVHPNGIYGSSDGGCDEPILGSVRTASMGALAISSWKAAPELEGWGALPKYQVEKPRHEPAS
jgi:hypothetical protein